MNNQQLLISALITIAIGFLFYVINDFREKITRLEIIVSGEEEEGEVKKKKHCNCGDH